MKDEQWIMKNDQGPSLFVTHCSFFILHFSLLPTLSIAYPPGTPGWSPDGQRGRFATSDLALQVARQFGYNEKLNRRFTRKRMWKNSLSLRVAAPTVLVSGLLLAFCIAAVVFLYSQQATSAGILSENVSSAHVAHNLEITLADLLSLPHLPNDQVSPLHKTIRQLLDQASLLADKAEEKTLVSQMEESYQRYLKLRETSFAVSAAGEANPAQDAVKILETETLPACKALQQFNERQVQESETAHRTTVTFVVLGLVGVGTVGSFAGLLLGYGVARGLQRSIYHLSVRVQDATNKLGQDLPPVALAENGDLHHLHDQMQGVVHEIEQVVEKLQQREREVLRAEQLASVGQLATGVAHELRNPLTSIKMLVQTNREEIQARGLPVEDLDVIDLEIRRMQKCLQTFLDFARPPRLERRPLDLAQPVQRTLALVSGRASKQHVRLNFTPPAIPVVVDADLEQLQQLLVNLALNALDVMPSGGELEISIEPPTKGYVTLRVCDTGPGILPELLPRLFRPFVSSKETGIGLGLVISRRIAEGHGGSLQATNRPEGGACLLLRLPLAATGGC
jgi:signal transduction histidine kinase